MSRKLDQILVIDIEASCWPGKIPPGQENEIIEVGVCLLEIASGERVGRDSILVRPERSTISPFCTKLTTLTQAQVETGVSFKAACDLLQTKYQAKNRIWASYGAYDRQQFERQCHAWRVDYPFGPTHINVKNLLALVYHLPREVGLTKALALLNLPLEGTHHRGDDDAWNIAGVLGRLLAAARIGLEIE